MYFIRIKVIDSMKNGQILLSDLQNANTAVYVAGKIFKDVPPKEIP